MKTILVVFDSLNRTAIAPYGAAADQTPNFARLAKRGVTFDRHYAGSLPCMPARRDMHTGRLNLTHRPWGPLEPFDNSYARLLSAAGCYTHMVTDHYHYFEAGGAGYATAFDSWEFVRGQEYDPVQVRVDPPLPELSAKYDPRQYPLERLAPGPKTSRSSDRLAYRRMQHALNAEAMTEEADFPLAQCFDRAFTFLDVNKDADSWFLQLECFDPHEPFHAPARFANPQAREGARVLDWPVYEKVANSQEEIDEIRGSYTALLRMCDDYLGRLLDWMDETGAWEDTCLIVTTDHGFLLGEHEWWGKNKMPCYEEIAHIPLMISHPAHAAQAGTRCDAVTQTIDIMPTLCELHGVAVPDEVRAQSLLRHLSPGAPAPERRVIFGLFGGPLSITDGRHTYMHYPDRDAQVALNMYTLAPSHMSDAFSASELAEAELSRSFDFTKGVKVLQVPVAAHVKESGIAAANEPGAESALYDLQADPGQARPIDAPEIVAALKDGIAEEFARHDAPAELYRYYGLEPVTTPALEPAL